MTEKQGRGRACEEEKGEGGGRNRREVEEGERKGRRTWIVWAVVRVAVSGYCTARPDTPKQPISHCQSIGIYMYGHR